MTSLLFAAPEQFDASFLKRLPPLLPPKKQADLQRIRNERARRESTLGWALLVYAWRLRFSEAPLPALTFFENGKPGFADDPFFFSISHTDTLVCLALNETGEIGADAQSPKAPSDALTRKVLTEAEQDVLSAADDKALCFTRFWTMKEAFVKQTGEGLSRAFGTLDFAPFAGADRFSAFGLDFSVMLCGNAVVSQCARRLSAGATRRVTQEDMENVFFSEKNG